MNTDPPETIPPPIPELPASSPVSPRTIRSIELLLLLAVAFGPSLYAAIAVFAGGLSTSSPASHSWTSNLIHEVSALGLCAYILHKQGRSIRQLGLTWRWFDPFYGLAITLLGLVAMTAVQWTLYLGGFYTSASRASHAAVVGQMFGASATGSMLVFTVVNAFFEELIVRAYLITDLRFLTGSTTIAVLVSILFQGAYHLYQGWQAALAATAGFLVFSLFYVWSRRITAVVFAHMFWDLYIIAYYFAYWRSHPSS